jgi:hypothetical protein
MVMVWSFSAKKYVKGDMLCMTMDTARDTDQERPGTERVTITVAATALGVNRKTIYKMSERGELTRIEEGGKGFIPADQVRVLRERMRTLSGQSESSKNGTATDGHIGHGQIVSVPREHYEGLLMRLGQLEAREQLLIEHKVTVERQTEELQAARMRIAELEADRARVTDLENQLKTARRPWWKRIFGAAS